MSRDALMGLEEFKKTIGEWEAEWLGAIEKCQSVKELDGMRSLFRKDMKKLMGELWRK